MKQVTEVDIAIIGGGMVGGAFALAMARQGRRVALVERDAPTLDWPRGEIHLRVSAINHASQAWLDHLGAWPAILARGVSPYRRMEVQDALGKGRISFDSAEAGLADLGHIIENRVIVAALWAQLAEVPHVWLHAPARIQDVTLHARHSEVQLASGEVIATRLLVGADGGDSLVRRVAGIRWFGSSYDQHALVGHVVSSQPHGETARQWFLPLGPLAFLPLADGRCSIVWSTSPTEAARLRDAPEASFLRDINAIDLGALGEIQAVGPREVFPLRWQNAGRYVDQGLALIGDAAHRLHPLAGQGVNPGFQDAMALSEALRLVPAEHLGDLEVLRPYERTRRGPDLAMVMAMDGFKRLFSNEMPLAVHWRSLGLGLVDRLPLLKRLLMSQAMGQGDWKEQVHGP